MIISFKHKGLEKFFATGEFVDGNVYVLDYEDYH
jgi:plasmid maintenance system killer protein